MARGEATQSNSEIHQRYRTVLAHTPVILFATDEAGIFTLVEGKGLEAMGLKAGQLVGQSAFERYSYLPEAVNALHRALAGEEVKWEGEAEGRFLEISLAPLETPEGAITGAIGMSLDVTERRQTEERQRFLSEASRALGSSIEYEITLSNIAQLAVPFLADWCSVDIRDANGALRTVAIAHSDPSKAALAAEIMRRYPSEVQRSVASSPALEGGEPVLIAHIPPAMLEASAADPERLELIRAVEPCSYMLVPLLVRGSILGALSFVMGPSGRHYTPQELALAQELAHRCALAVDNARLYREAREAEQQLRLQAIRLQGLVDISKMLAESQLDLKSRLEHITRYVSDLTGDICVIHLLNDEHLPRLAAFHYQEATTRPLGLNRLPILAEELLERVLLRGRPLLIPALAEGWRENLLPAELWPYEEAMLVHSLLIVPLLVQAQTIGTLALLRPVPDAPYTTEDQLHLQEFADRAALSIQNAQLFEQVRAKQERLQLLSRQLIGAQEQERRHIARELHDVVGQSLTATKLNMEMLLRNPLPSPVQPWVKESTAILEQALEQIRTLSLDLRPALLDDLGLRSALRWHLTRQAQRNGWSASLVVEPASVALPTEIETTCFRIVQEALTNTARHAQATEVAVELCLQEGELHLTISDNGVGFDVQAARQGALRGSSMGVLGMEERALLAGGQLTITSHPGQGCLIRARFPLPSASKIS